MPRRKKRFTYNGKEYPEIYEETFKKEGRIHIRYYFHNDQGNIPKFFNDDGTEVNPDLIPKPSLCITCRKEGLPGEEILCDLNRMSQQEEEFKCGAYEPKQLFNED
jgi:SET domain-containing protein